MNLQKMVFFWCKSWNFFSTLKVKKCFSLFSRVLSFILNVDWFRQTKSLKQLRIRIKRRQKLQFKEQSFYKKTQILETLFVRHKCVGQYIRKGIWINRWSLTYYVHVTIEMRHIFDSNVYFQLVRSFNYNAFIRQIVDAN